MVHQGNHSALNGFKVYSSEVSRITCGRTLADAGTDGFDDTVVHRFLDSLFGGSEPTDHRVVTEAQIVVQSLAGGICLRLDLVVIGHDRGGRCRETIAGG